MEEIIVRNAKIDDAEAIQHIIHQWRSCSPAYQMIFWNDLLQHIGETISEEKIEKRREKIKNQEDYVITIVAESTKNKTIIGVCNGSLQCEGEEILMGTNWSLLDYSSYGELRVLYINPQSQRQWIWRLLLNYLEQRIYKNQKKWIILKTLRDNKQSNNFYKKHWYNLTPYQCTFTRRNTTAVCNIYIKTFNA